MKVVVTGASGSVGTALLRAAGTERWELTGIARRRPPARDPYTRARWIDCDIGESSAVPVLTEAFSGATAVVHLAWAIHPRRTDPPMNRTNVLGTEHVLRAAAATGVAQVVCASSVAAYTPADRWTRVDESHPRTGLPSSAYSSGKAALESRLDEFEQRQPGITVARIRPCGIAQGDSAAELGDWLLSPWLPRAVIGHRGLPVPLWKDLRLQLVHATDVAAAIRAILRDRAVGAFDLAAEPVLAARTLATVFGGFRLPVPRAVLTAGAGLSWRMGLQPLHPAWLELADRACLVGAGRAARELGWIPEYDAITVCRELMSRMRSGPPGPSAPLDPGWPRFRLGQPTHQDQRPESSGAAGSGR
ncbi:NAD-dependent epimerase/dehydratase family protein [Nocardia carnea]|uniref:NAD-dependent epimerase/dehydratase family protein n=1 Tax=Nocardia carnea TaxID=37328 RepID=UPI002457A433|nr:NAD-dependent epimerase/dehydratase family protein [Nocardia carnea]